MSDATDSLIGVAGALLVVGAANKMINPNRIRRRKSIKRKSKRGYF